MICTAFRDADEDNGSTIKIFRLMNLSMFSSSSLFLAPLKSSISVISVVARSFTGINP